MFSIFLPLSCIRATENKKLTTQILKGMLGYLLSKEVIQAEAGHIQGLFLLSEKVSLQTFKMKTYIHTYIHTHKFSISE